MAKSKSYPCKTVVVTNLQYVTVRGVRMHCNAITIVDNPSITDDGKSRDYRLHGFGTTTLWPVFDLWLASAEHDWDPGDSRHTANVLSQDGSLRPLSTGGFVRVHERDRKEPTILEVICNNDKLGVEFHTIEGSFVPGDRDDESWFHYNQAIGTHILERSMAVEEAFGYPRNAFGVIPMPPVQLRDILRKINQV